MKIKCIMCEVEIKDGGLLFCSFCRDKDIIERISCFKKTKYLNDLGYIRRTSKPKKRYFSDLLNKKFGDDSEDYMPKKEENQF